MPWTRRRSRSDFTSYACAFAGDLKMSSDVPTSIRPLPLRSAVKPTSPYTSV